MDVMIHVSVKTGTHANGYKGGLVLKRLARKTLLASKGLPLVASLRPNAAVILMYHSVREPEQDANWIGPGITHATGVFSRQMELVALKFNPVTIEDVLLFVKGEKSIPNRAVAITFDDGYRDNLEFGAPILQRIGLHAAFYVTTALIGQAEAPWFSRLRRAFLSTRHTSWKSSGEQRTWDLSTAPARDAALSSAYELCAALAGDTQRQAVETIERELEVDSALPERRLMMNWNEVRTLRSAGHVVGSHTVTHPNVAHVPEEAARVEFVESKRQIEMQLQEPVAHFSYPHPALNPQWTETTLEMASQAGYATAVTTTRGPVRAGANPLSLKRMHAPRPEDEFLWTLERAFAAS
jgi:peptidoglycan/xylan/chitin deacetylase (PgdA/CDA1 family)